MNEINDLMGRSYATPDGLDEVSSKIGNTLEEYCKEEILFVGRFYLLSYIYASHSFFAFFADLS